MTFCIICDKCGNDTWYVIGPKPYEDAPTYQIQVCTKCGFATKITYKLVDVKLLEADDALEELKKNSKSNQKY